MSAVIFLIIGLVVGMVAVWVITQINKRDAQKIAQELVASAQAEKLQDIENFLTRMKESFYSVSLEALDKNISNILEMAKSTLSQQSQINAKELDSKKDLISQSLQQIKGEMDKVAAKITDFEKERQSKYGELSGQLLRLGDTTSKLTETLASSGVRGQWGQRMAEDVLRLSGFVEGVNYFKQKTLDYSSQRPDFTFVLPNRQKINMDVKFPFANYQGYLQAKSDEEKGRYRDAFLRDVRKHLKNLSSHDYISPEENTLDMVIMFIPNEQVYAFINQSDSTLLDEAVSSKVVICSPLTLFAILAIIRQAIDNFNLEQTASEMLTHMGSFYKQWGMFLENLDQLGKRIDGAQKEFAKLTTTRKNQLEKPLEQIERLRLQKGLPIAETDLAGINRLELTDSSSDESAV
jgi:DNA recombination protein RmuC